MPAFLTAREVCQRLRDAALEVVALRRIDEPCGPNLVAVDLEGWQRYGTDPVSLLSTWELAQIERLLLRCD
jgi:hypothetical protein